MTASTNGQELRPATNDAKSKGADRRRLASERRGQETRALILDAAIAEFAEKGFEATSIRTIADRLGIQHPLITYHYRVKDALWRAAAEHAFSRIQEDWDRTISDSLGPLERLREEYRALFQYTVAFPEFHKFMRRETTTNNPRLKWVAEKMVKPILERLIPQIEAAQKLGLLPPVRPILFHYMMVSLTAALSEFGPEMAETSGVSPESKATVSSYWSMVDEIIFEGRVRRLGPVSA